MSAKLLPIGFVCILMILISQIVNSFEDDEEWSLKRTQKATKPDKKILNEILSLTSRLEEIVHRFEPEEKYKKNKPIVSIPGDDGVVYKKYHIIDYKLVDFVDAIDTCEAREYRLASIKNQKEFDLLTQHLSRYYKHRDKFWTSGNNIGPEGRKFVWNGITLGQEAYIDPSWWWEDEPNNLDHGGVKEHCIELLGKNLQENRKLAFKLNDHVCHGRKYPICEENLTY